MTGAQLDPRPARSSALVLDQPLAALHRADMQAAPEHVAALHVVGLAVVHEAQRDALVSQPGEGVPRVLDEEVDQLRVRPALPQAVMSERKSSEV